MTKTEFRSLLFALGLVCSVSVPARTAFAAGAVEMQVDRIVKIAILEYNAAMQEGNPAGWLKYFTDNVRRRDPQGGQDGKEQFAAYYGWEFENFRANWSTNKMVIGGRSGVVAFEWEAVHKRTGAPLKVNMVAVFELAASGKFESVDFYFDTAKFGNYLAGQPAQGQ